VRTRRLVVIRRRHRRAAARRSQQLARSPYVARFENAAKDEGGDGATVYFSEVFDRGAARRSARQRALGRRMRGWSPAK
jgi:hypothetical protein